MEIEAARAVTGITDVEITARVHDFIAAWPEGSSYLGFLFARGGKRGRVERSLRDGACGVEVYDCGAVGGGASGDGEDGGAG